MPTPSSAADGTSDQAWPPSDERSRPTPYGMSPSPSPVPAYSTCGAEADWAIAPITSVGWRSVNGAQLAPASRLPHRPPPAEHSTRWRESLRSTTMPEQRPDTDGLAPVPLP